MFVNPLLNQSINQPKKTAAPTPKRKERSDKQKDLKIPLTAAEWGYLTSLLDAQKRQGKNVCQTDVNTQLLVSAICDAEQHPEEYPSVPYDASQKFITCKPTVFYHDKIKSLRVTWDLRSIRKVAHRLMHHAIRKAGERNG